MRSARCLSCPRLTWRSSGGRSFRNNEELVKKYGKSIRIKGMGAVRASSPLWNARHATLTISVVQAPSLAAKDQPFLGVGSSYLASLRKGDRVALSVRPSNAAFHLPQDPSVPVIMFAAGSGLAPMRGFIQERAEQKKAGREVGRMLLYYGCRTPENDYLYSDSDLKEWSALGVVEVRPAFSRKPEASHGRKYVQQ